MLLLLLLLIFLETDVDEFEEIASKFEVTSLPHTTFLDSSNGPSKTYSYIGSDYDALAEMAEQFIYGSLESLTSETPLEPDIPGIFEVILEHSQCSEVPAFIVPAGFTESVFTGTDRSHDWLALEHIVNDMDSGFHGLSFQPTDASQSIVSKAFSPSTRISSDMDRIPLSVEGRRDVYELACLRELYAYQVPTLNAAGTCSNLSKLAKRPMSLAHDAYRMDEDIWKDEESLLAHPLTRRLQSLNNIVNQLRLHTGADWIGVYRMVKADGELALLKESYLGEPSRSVFPVNEEFAHKSTNSWVALHARGRSIPDTHNRGEGVAYYECSGKVKSELCVPIYRKRLDGTLVWEVVGIIDLESWRVNHFDHQMICDVIQVAFDLGNHENFSVLPFW